MPVTIQCLECDTLITVIPARASTCKFCSNGCRGAWQRKHSAGEKSSRWQGGERRKTCFHCGVQFEQRRREAVVAFARRKFCSKECADQGGLRYFGADNWKWTGNPRRKHRESKQASWARAVISRDLATCQKCGATDVELHAHHLIPYKDAPAKRWDISNGQTLCYQCHWDEHTGPVANGVNSGEAAAGHAGGNPEPSFGRKPVEGVTTRGRAYRRWDGSCDWCKTFISKRWSDTVGKRNLFCSKRCAGKFKAENFGIRKTAHGSNASTSALAERHDIVWAHVKA